MAKMIIEGGYIIVLRLTSAPVKVGFPSLLSVRADFILRCLFGHKTMQVTNDAMNKLLIPPKHWIKTLTFDNGREFSRHNELSKTVKRTTKNL